MDEKRLKAAKDAVKTAGDYLTAQFRKRHSLILKEDKTVLLKEDIKSEEILMSTLAEAFPQDSFFTEKTETEISSDYIWVFDPLCGSYSYLRGVETWSVSTALVCKDEYLIGVVYQPLLNNIFYS